MKGYKKKAQSFTTTKVTLDELGRQCTNVYLLNDGMHANFRQPRQKFTLCTALPSPEYLGARDS